MNKNIIIAILILVMCGVSGLAGWTLAKRASDRGVIKQQTKDAKEVMDHDLARKDKERKVGRILTRIKGINDPSKCLDTSSPPDYLNGLLDADREAKSGLN